MENCQAISDYQINNELSSHDQKERALLKIFRDLLGDNDIGINDNFFERGGDSLSMMQCIGRANQIGIEIFMEIFMINPTVSYLIRRTCLKNANEKKFFSKKNIPLLPLQERFFKKPKHWSNVNLISNTVLLVRSVDLAVLKTACKKLHAIHDALNLRYEKRGDKWFQFLDKNKNFYFKYYNLCSNNSDNEKNSYLYLLNQELSHYDISNGPLVKFLVMDPGSNQPYLFSIASHHLCIDGFSFQILIEDIFHLYNSLVNQIKPVASRNKTSFVEWAYFLFKYSDSEDIRLDLTYWQKYKIKDVAKLPIDFKSLDMENIASDCDEIKYKIDSSLSENIFKKITKKLKKISIFDILLTAFVASLNVFTASNSQLIDIRRHGRDFSLNGVNLTKTVGWLTVVHPVLLSLNKNICFLDALNSIHQQIQSIPRAGLSYGLLRYMTSDKDIQSQMNEIPASQITFNYHGILDAIFLGNDLFSFYGKTISNNFDSNVTRAHLINFDIFACNGNFHVVWTYNKKFHKFETIDALQKSYEEFLRKILNSFLN
jgi:non-ribosomal peptide synthase protein (TIGR01720 family)